MPSVRCSFPWQQGVVIREGQLRYVTMVWRDLDLVVNKGEVYKVYASSYAHGIINIKGILVLTIIFVFLCYWNRFTGKPCEIL